MLKPNFDIGQIVDNSELTKEFGCSTQGGMRKSKKTNTLVLISNHVTSKNKIYDDKKIGDVYHYTGMGLIGDQALSFAQNKTLAESGENKIEIHFFEVFKPQRYTYMGRVSLSGTPYQERQLDADGNERSVWMFPLKMAEESNPSSYLSSQTVSELNKQQEKFASELNYDELKSRAVYYGNQASARKVTSQTYIRNPYVAELTKRRSKGICELCKNAAPFNDTAGKPYLESHHIKWLSRKGPDIIENTVALCPNCHKKMHIVDSDKDIAKLSLLSGRQKI